MPQELVRRDEVIVHEDKEELRMMLRVAYERGRLLMHPDELFWRALADGSWAVKAPMLLPPKPVKRPSAWQRWTAWNTVTGSIVKALIFVLALLALGLTLLAVAFSMAIDSLRHAGPALLGGAALFGLIVLLSALGNSSHGHGGGYGYHWSKCK